METFRYRLQVLFDRKAELKKEAERAWAAARERLRDVEARLEKAREAQGRLEASRADHRARLLTGEVDAIDLRRRVDDLALLGRRIEEAKDEVMSARLAIEERKEELEKAAADLTAAAREVEVLAKHRARGERRFRVEQERREAIAQDEIASALHQRRRS
jgi:flagellar biosynthesis chaperone FliJ